MYAHHMNQFNIAKRIVGSWLGKSDRMRKVRIELVNTAPTVWSYKLTAYGYTVDLFIHTNGKVFAELRAFGRVACTSSTIAGFCSLIKNCKRWSEGEAK